MLTYFRKNFSPIKYLITCVLIFGITISSAININYNTTEHYFQNTGQLRPLNPPTLKTKDTPYIIKVTPNGKFAYIALSIGHVLQVSIGANGQLTPLATPILYNFNDITSINVTPNGRFAYIADGNTVFEYGIGTDGELIPLTQARISINGTSKMAITRDGRFAYISSGQQKIISQFSISMNGQLEPLNPATVDTVRPAYEIAITPDPDFVYAVNTGDNSISQYKININNGQLEPLSPATVATEAFPQKISITSSGFVYVTNYSPQSASISQYKININNGQLEPLSPATVHTMDGAPFAIAIASDKFAYVVGKSSVSQFNIGMDGQLHFLTPATVPAGDHPFGIVITPDNYVYVTNVNSNDVSQYQIESGQKNFYSNY